MRLCVDHGVLLIRVTPVSVCEVKIVLSLSHLLDPQKTSQVSGSVEEHMNVLQTNNDHDTTTEKRCRMHVYVHEQTYVVRVMLRIQKKLPSKELCGWFNSFRHRENRSPRNATDSDDLDTHWKRTNTASKTFAASRALSWRYDSCIFPHPHGNFCE